MPAAISWRPLARSRAETNPVAPYTFEGIRHKCQIAAISCWKRAIAENRTGAPRRLDPRRKTECAVALRDETGCDRVEGIRIGATGDRQRLTRHARGKADGARGVQRGAEATFLAVVAVKVVAKRGRRNGPNGGGGGLRRGRSADRRLCGAQPEQQRERERQTMPPCKQGARRVFHFLSGFISLRNKLITVTVLPMREREGVSALRSRRSHALSDLPSNRKGRSDVLFPFLSQGFSRFPHPLQRGPARRLPPAGAKIKQPKTPQLLRVTQGGLRKCLVARPVPNGL